MAFNPNEIAERMRLAGDELNAARAAAWAAEDAAGDAAWDAAGDAQSAELRRVCLEWDKTHVD